MFNKLFIAFLITSFASVIRAQNWLQMDISSDVHFFYVDTIDNVLYAGGQVGYVGGKNTANGFGIWNGTSWDTLPNKLNGTLNSICRYKNKIYVTGYFYNQPFNCPSRSLMAWDLTTLSWDSVGNGLWSGGQDGGGAKMIVINNELYFYGAFDHVFNLQAINIVKFDGTNWTSLNYPSYPETVNGIAYYNGELYAYGQFTDFMGDPNSDFLVKYNGTNWVSTGADFNGATSIESMTVYKNELYVVGYFLKSNGCPGDGIAKYDGNSWQEVNGGFSLYGSPNSVPRHLEVYNDKLYITGNFDKMGTMPAKSVVMYDGVQFCAVDNSIGQSPGPIAVFQNKIYIGSSWFVASGPNYQDTIWYMGQQNKFTLDTCSIFAVGEKELIKESISTYPNPTNSILNISDEQNELQNSFIEIKNYLGQSVFYSPFTPQIDLSRISAGMYFLTVQNGNNKKTFKIIKQ